eukprot:8265889-Ditylum_brightwellii.AAC.1
MSGGLRQSVYWSNRGVILEPIVMSSWIVVEKWYNQEVFTTAVQAHLEKIANKSEAARERTH